MAACSSASLHAMHRPIIGIRLRPVLVVCSSASMPLATRGAQASASPSFGASFKPVLWQVWQNRS